MEPKDSLIIGDEDLRTIPEKESNKFIESSVEDLVPIPKESKDTSDSDNECDLPFCDDSLIFPNPLFDVNEDFTTSNDGSRPEEDVHEENFKIYSNYLFEFYDKYISKGDMIYRESLVINDTIPNLPPDVFLDHDPRSLMDEPDNDDLKSMVKEYQKKDKIRSKPDKNEKRIEAGKSLKQLQLKEEEKPKKAKKE
nr:hypothetical protein [Tanacetum cinerariifolium]